MDGDELDELVEVVFPFVSGSRWVADCPRCRGGVGCTVGYPRGCCYDCGGILTRISWPKKDVLDAGVATLELRPQESRHWTPMNESPQDLRFENIAHGFPIPSDEG